MFNPVNAMIFTMLVWGIGPVFVRSLSVGLGAADALVIRYALVSIGYAIGLYVVSRVPIQRQDWPRLLFISIFGIFGYNLGSVFGFELVPAGIGGIIIGTQPLLIVLISAILSRKAPSPPAIAGVLIGFAGTALLFWNDLIFEDDRGGLALGAIYIFLSGLAWAFYVVLAKPLILKYGTYQITSITILLATVPILSLTSFSTFETLFTMTGRQWLEMFYMVVIASLIATVTWNYAASRLSSVATGAFLYLVPVIAVAAGALFLGEAVTPSMIAGGALILLGVAVTQYSDAILAYLPFAARRQFYAHAALCFAVLMWGLVPVGVRFLVSDLRPETLLVIRLFPTGVLAVLALLILGMRPIAREDWPRILAAVVLGNCGYQVLAHIGLKMVPASWTGMVFGLEPLFIVLFAVLLAGERLSVHLATGMAIALSGIAVLTVGSVSFSHGDVDILGLGLLVLGTMGWGLYTVLIRPLSRKYGSFETACLTLATTAIPMALFVRPGIDREIALLSATDWGVLSFLVVIGTFLSLMMWNYGVSRIESSAAGMWLYVQPVVAAVGGVLLLHERITWPLVLGGAIIIAGVAVSQWHQGEEVEAIDEEPESFPGDTEEAEHERADSRLDIRDAVERLVASSKEAQRLK
jgi:drug/metabolite transporter (DMT)-like permease